MTDRNPKFYFNPKVEVAEDGTHTWEAVHGYTWDLYRGTGETLKDAIDNARPLGNMYDPEFARAHREGRA